MAYRQINVSHQQTTAVMKKDSKPQSALPTDLNFEDAMRVIAQAPKEAVDKLMKDAKKKRTKSTKGTT